jgi:hypothetical protein
LGSKRLSSGERMRKIIILILAVAVISVASIGVISTKLTSINFGLDGQTKTLFTMGGFYEPGTTVYSGDTYYFVLNNGTFHGWYTAKDGYDYHFTGTYKIDGRSIKGTWKIDDVHGWLSGTLGV